MYIIYVGCRPLGHGGRGWCKDLRYANSVKNSADAVSYRFSQRPCYHSDRAGLIMPKRGSPMVILLVKVIHQQQLYRHCLPNLVLILSAVIK